MQYSIVKTWHNSSQSHNSTIMQCNNSKMTTTK